MRISGHFNALKHNYIHNMTMTEIINVRFYQELETAVDNKVEHYTISVRSTHTLLVFIAMVHFIDDGLGYI